MQFIKYYQRCSLSSIAAIVAAAIFIFGCGGNKENTAPAPAAAPSPQTADTSHAGTTASGNLEGKSAHSGMNADGIAPTVQASGVTLVGWDELVRNGKNYDGKIIQVKALVGGTVPNQSNISTAYVFPLDMNLDLMKALMEFTLAQPNMDQSMPVQCIFDTKSSASKIHAGKISVIEGTATFIKTAPASSFMLQRGITTANYMIVHHAKVVK